MPRSPSIFASSSPASSSSSSSKKRKTSLSIFLSKCKGIYSIICLLIFTTFVFTLYAVFCVPFSHFSRKWLGMGQEMVQRTWVFMLISLCSFCSPNSIIKITIPTDDDEMLHKVLYKIVRERREDLWNRVHPSQTSDLHFGEEIESLIPKILLKEEEELQPSRRRDVIICNHQIYLDWIYIWSLMRQLNRHGSTKIIAKHSLQKIPIIGWGMRMMNFIFLHRNWARDSCKLGRRLRRLIWFSIGDDGKKKDEPVSLVVYPEGTTFCSDMLKKSKAYHKKMGNEISLKEHPRYTLLPRVTGLHFILQEIGKDLDGIFDLTVAYDGTDKDAGNDDHSVSTDQQATPPPPSPSPPSLFPEQIWGAYRLFMLGESPPTVHINIKYHKISEIPFISKDSAIPLTPNLTAFSSASLSSVDESTDREVESDVGNVSDLQSIKTKTISNDLLFSSWLFERFAEKDVLLREFYEKGEFPGNAKCTIPIGDPWFGVTVATISTIIAIIVLVGLFLIFYHLGIYIYLGFFSLLALM